MCSSPPHSSRCYPCCRCCYCCCVVVLASFSPWKRFQSPGSGTSLPLPNGCEAQSVQTELGILPGIQLLLKEDRQGEQGFFVDKKIIMEVKKQKPKPKKIPKRQLRKVRTQSRAIRAQAQKFSFEESSALHFSPQFFRSTGVKTTFKTRLRTYS